MNGTRRNGQRAAKFAARIAASASQPRARGLRAVWVGASWREVVPSAGIGQRT